MIFLFFLYLSVLDVINFSASFTDYGPQPRILSRDGHLVFISAEHKNISFLTEGVGRVHVNGVDLTRAAQITDDAIQAMAKYKTNFKSSFEKIHRFEQLLDGEDGLLQKLLLLQDSSRNSTTVSPLFTRSIRRLNRRITGLHARVSNLENLLIKDECLSNPCKNGGTCVDLFNSFLCHCPPEWEGENCDTDVNECTRFAGTDLGCQNEARCINKPGGYECVCTRGWYGVHCTKRSNDCNSGSSTELCGHGTCISQNNEFGYKCICDQGWTTDGTNPACNTDVDECKTGKPACSVNPTVECVNLPGSFRCGNCPAGYTGNGYHCTDINECELFNGGCSLNPLVQCINTLGSRICGTCPPGYTGNGMICSYQGSVCATNNGGCHPLATCQDNHPGLLSYVQCICPSGYTGSGIGPRGCTPLTGYNFQPCTPNPCVHGVCSILNTTGAYICRCHQRWTGRNCDSLRDVCVSNPCLNGGSCVSVLGISFRCICPSAYVGQRCEEERQACGGQLRTENGTLIYPIGSMTTYNHRINCAWIIETNVTKVLNITFMKFDLESSRNCQFDWLQIHDGRNTLAPSLGRFCGNQLPNGGVITSTHNIIYLWFRTDNTIAKTGFELKWESIDPVCGDTITVTSHGSIKSPGSPGNYPNKRDCYWILSAPTGKRLLFHFFTLIIGDNPDCDHDYLEFISGQFTTDPVFEKYCNTSHPQPLFSPGPDVLIHFHSDESRNYPGFQITYSVVEGIPGCGGVYTSEQGEIRSPSFDGRYPSDLFCEYKIKLSHTSRIKLTFLSFALEASEQCRFDHVSIYNGPNTDSPLIGRYCGRNLPAPYVTRSNQVLVVFQTDWSTSDEGFVLKYETVCGGKFTNPTGTIQSIGYPLSYSGQSNCIYEIVQPIGTSITLTFIELSLETNSYPHCIYDYVEVRDGDNENSTLIGRYCSKPPPPIISTYNYLWIRFVSDVSVEDIGFQANYTTTRIGCGGILKENIGTIRSPNHPNEYEENHNCEWILSAPPGYVIQIIWMNFHLEESSSCSFDYVEVFDNNTETGMGGSMGKFCGHSTPPILLSSSNIVTIKFVTDKTINSDGFLASYTFILDANVCGGNYYTSSGILKTPNYPQSYPYNIECTWVIHAEPGHQIMLNITDFEIEYDANCRYDWLKIRNGATSSSPLLDTYCGTRIPRLIPSHTNTIYLKFKSDLTKSLKGFKIYWDSTSTGCGGDLTSPTGSITSPNYPEPYPDDLECIWKISVSAGSVIEVVFSDIDLEQHSSCAIDYVEFFNGPNMNSNSLGRYCKLQPTQQIKTSTNHLTVKFVSDVADAGRGFQLQYNTMCNNTLTGFRGTVESPNFPYLYPHNLNCIWDIKVSDKNKINITFSHFDLESESPGTNSTGHVCLYDYLQISYKQSSDDYEDEDDDFIKYDRYCGDETPPLITLNSDHARIQFVTDGLLVGNGFRFEWQIEGCGGLLTKPVGTIVSPNYPRGYPHLVVCVWQIQTEPGNSIEITFPVIDIEKDNNCGYDYIEIFNGIDDTYPELTRLCHQNKPTTIVSTGSSMFIKFKADGSYRGRGFYGNYSTKYSKCGGTYTATNGYIMSPNYPNNFDVKDTCGWLIDVDEHHLVELTFEDIDLPNVDPHNSSIGTFIKVYDGPSAAYPLLITLTEKQKPNNTIKSSYNHLYVEMISNTEQVSKGFKAKYRKACGARIEATNSGIITMSPENVDYEYSSTCSWTIVAHNPKDHVSLTITYLHISFNYCDNYTHNLMIYGGESDKSPVLGEYCSSKVPPTITSRGSALHIVANYHVYFTATFSVYDSECGGTLISQEGNFASPGYPTTYPTNVECEWTLAISEGNRVSLNFLSFELVSSENCNTDYLEIRRWNSSGKLLGVFCNNNLPENITHVGNLWIYLKTSAPEGASTAKGFLAEYKIDSSVELSGDFGIISSPLYPKSTKLDNPHTWKITVRYHKKILLTFKDFIMEDYDSSCMMTSLLVYDGDDETGSLLKTLCGTELPKPIESTTNVVFLKTYISYRYDNRFLLEWRAIEDRPSPFPGIKSEKCGEEETIDLHLRKNETVITSPGYPNGYKDNLECQWIFSTISMNSISLYFEYINFERQFSPQCYQDYVEVFQKRFTSPDWQSLGRFCNDSNFQHVHATNLMKVKFISNRFFNGSGFSARVKEECGGEMYEPTGFIYLSNSSFPDYSSRYSKSDCQWNVTVRSGRQIKIEFIEFNLEKDPNSDNCLSYLTLRNGQFPDSPFLGSGKYCGNSLPPNLETTGNHLYIKYSTHLSSGQFKLKYSEISYDCDVRIILHNDINSTEITSPNYPNVPHSHTECSWTIVGPPRESLRIDFHDRFDLASSSQCNKEYVEIHDGGTEYSPLLARFCGETPSSKISTSNVMYIKYFTDVDEPGNGFKAKISIAKCGGNLRGRNGVVQYTHENLHTTKNPIDCTWRIIGLLDHTVKLTFNKFDLYKSTNCSSNEYIEIYENNQTSEDVSNYGPYCGDQIPENIESSSNEIFVKFTSLGEALLRTSSFSIIYNSSIQECGGLLESDFGTVRSPVFRQPYRRCKWIIKVPRGRRVTFEILDLDIGETDIRGGGISFFSGENFKSHITTLSGGSTQRIIKSSENYMIIYYWSHGSNHRGFYGKFSSDEPTVCRGDFGQLNGILINPENTSEAFYCTYIHTIEGRLNKTVAISIQISMNSTRRYARCVFAQDFIYVVAENNRDYLARICNNIDHPLIVRSPLPKTKILVARSYSIHLNYTIIYDTYPCGGVINGESGTISSPNYPNKYDKSIECSWLLNLPEDQTIKLTPVTINLGKDCDKSYIEIYNGNLPTKPKIDKYCGNNLPTILSQTNSLWINYKYDKDSSDSTGFSFKYEPVINGCGGIFHDVTRIIQTPNYPKDYPNNAECLWEIRCNTGYHISLQFISRFQIEETDNCVNDFLQIWDWRDDEWVDMGRKCGRDSISSFNSTSTRMKILFRSNDRIAGAGFQAQWNWKCGGIFEADNNERYIYSPGYPESYKSDMNCEYTIRGPPLKYIYVRFLDFNLEGVRPSCKFDNLTISSVVPMRLAHYTRQTYCGNTLPPDVRLSRFININFKTDKFINKIGFKLSYKLDSCDETITEPKMISSPSLKNTRSGVYQSYVTCIWNITAPPKKIIVVQFEQFDLPTRYNCFYDNVDIFEDMRLRSRIANLCGNLNRNLPVIKSKNNTLAIRLRVDRTVGSTGFKASIFFTHSPEEGCGGDIELTSTPYNLVAPNLRSMDCIWNVRAPSSNTIKIKFTWLSLDGSCNSKNNSDFLEIKDGLSPMSEVITKLCGIKGSFNEEFVTSGSLTQIRLYSSGIGQPVFRSTLTALPSPCGPAYLNATENKQILTSPNYPNQYPDNIKCLWVIKGRQKMALHFEDFDLLEDSPANSNGNKCLKDRLQIIDDPLNQVINDGLGPWTIISGNRKTTAEFSPYSTIVGYHQFCGKQKPFDYYTQKDMIVVKFSSGNRMENRGRGFKLEYQTIGCNRNFTSLQGRIYNTKFTDCHTTIIVPNNYTISIFFQQFLIFPAENCNQVGVEIRQNSQDGKMLLRACGYALPDPVFSSSNQIWIHAWNKRANHVSTYDLVYTSTDLGIGCGGTLYNYKGRFTSPLYPRPYKHNVKCEWTVKVPFGMRVAIKISDFNIQGNCDSTYLQITTNQSSVHTFCKNDQPAVIYSDNQLTVQYQSSVDNEGRGWLAQFEAVSDF